MTATKQPQGMVSSTDYKISSLQLVTSTGNIVDISKIVLELEIYEDIFAPVVTGSVRLADGGDIVSNFGLHGNEFLLLEIDKPSLDKPITKVFRTYKLSDRDMGQSLQNYTLYFASEELIVSNQMVVSKAYSGVPISTMVNDILVKKLQVNPNKMKNGILETSSGNFNIIVPRLDPFAAIEWLTPRAYAPNENLFLFFENRDGFNFTSYENLLKQPVYASYKRDIKIDTDPAKNLNSPTFLKVIEDFDILKSLRYGAYNTTLLNLDMIKRIMTTKTFGYKDIKPTGTLNGNVPDNGFKTRTNISLRDTSMSMIRFVLSDDSDPQSNPAHLENWMPQTISRLAQLHTFKLVMTVPGDVLLKAGAVVHVTIPKILNQQKSIANDPIRTGKYLVSAVHHSFKQDIMITTIELLSDSVSVSLGSPLNTSQSLDKVKRA